MLKELIVWIISFIVSTVFSKYTGTEQLFICMYVGSEVFLMVVGCVILVALNAKKSIPVKEMIAYLVELAITMAVTWELSKIFNVNFYVAYQLISIGQILYPGFISAEDTMNY